MAATIARAIGEDRTGRTKVTTRLGSKAALGEANTWRTFARVITFADGSGSVRVTRDGVTLHTFDYGPETGASAPDETAARCAACDAPMYGMIRIHHHSEDGRDVTR
jgi:hypothetical protein